ncbi:hypothetical protein Y032_0320g2406 [Ancylostoma ceylanicum]|uniref:Uncharacterized protein n=1 Tax=Ancylostoma ceylanicum TaxID=53326 RepID=A0A016S1A9_9BILA|nr:hypothetical protein Y032_0320g2406 [Ancylostoma ceylanicum]
MTPLFVAFLFVPAAANDDSSEDVKRYGYFFEYNDAFARKIMFPIVWLRTPRKHQLLRHAYVILWGM